VRIIIIAAVANNNVIGLNGNIPWHSSDDMKLFKETTSGYPVIMGRKTYQSLTKILPDRINIIISNSLKQVTGALVFCSLRSAINYCIQKKYEKIFIAGGGEIYSQSISFADELIISKFDLDNEGDIFFPKIEAAIWQLKNKIDFNGFSVYNYLRKLI